MSATWRLAALALVLGLLAGSGPELLGRAARGQDKAEELSEKELRQLQKEAAGLFRQGMEHYQKGRPDETLRAMEQCLALRRKLYPEARYPDGHAELAHLLNV